MHRSLPLFNFMQWKDKFASCSFTTKKLTHCMCQVSLVVKYAMYITSHKIANTFVDKKLIL